MPGIVSSVLNEGGADLRRRLIAIYAVLIGGNVLVWLWALVALSDRPVLLGTALLAYTFGLRHAVDADHIAAIDNVTRKLMQQGQRPVGVGFFFRSAIRPWWSLLSVAVAFAASELTSRFEFDEGGRRHYQHQRFGAVPVRHRPRQHSGAGLGLPHLSGGQARRTVRARTTSTSCSTAGDSLRASFVRCSGSSPRAGTCWRSGFLFGLGFDTATEVALFGISSTQAANGMSFSAIMVFPALFTAGMSLVDTTDGVLMLGAYGWAFMKPIRKLYYNMTITAVSVVVAVVIGGLETLNLIGDQLGLTDGGGFWGAIGGINDNFGILGYVIIGIFVLSWVGSVVFYKFKRYDELEIKVAAS